MDSDIPPPHVPPVASGEAEPSPEPASAAAAAAPQPDEPPTAPQPRERRAGSPRVSEEQLNAFTTRLFSATPPEWAADAMQQMRNLPH